MQAKLAKSSLNRHRTPRTVLLRMAADADRAQRLKQIKAERPDLKWRHIAEATGVSERTVAEWAKTGAMSYENAKKVAAFLVVDLDWLWRGPATAPDLMDVLSVSARDEQLDRIEAGIADLVALVGELGLRSTGEPGAERPDENDEDDPGSEETG